MLKHLSEFVVRIADLAEAEGRSLRHHLVRVALAVGLILVAALLLLCSLLALLAAMHIALESQMGPAGAWAIVGVLGLLVAAGLLYAAFRTTQSVGGEGRDVSTGKPGGGRIEL